MNMRLVITTLLGAVSGAVVAATAAPHGGFLLWCASALLAGAVCAALAPHEAVTITASGLPEAPFKDLANRLESLERVLPAALEAQTQALSQGLKPVPAAAVDLSPLVEELRKLQSSSKSDEAVVLRLGALETALGADLRALGSKLQATSPEVHVDLSGLESMLRSEIASLGSKLEVRESAVTEAPVVNVDLSGLESVLRSEIVNLGSKLESRESAVVEAPVVNVDLSGLESMLRSEIARLGSKLESRESAVVEAPVVNVDLSGLESVLRHEIASLGSKLESRESAVVEAPVVNVDLSGLESVLRSEIANLGSKLESRESVGATSDDEAIVLRLGALETALGADLRALGEKFQQASPEVSLDLGALESIVKQGNERVASAIASTRVDLSGLDALRKDITALFELMAERSVSGESAPASVVVDFAPVIDKLQAIEQQLSRPAPSPIVEVPPVDLSSLSEGLKAIQEEVFSLRDDLASAKPATEGAAAGFDERVPTALEAVRHQLENGSTRALELQGDIYLRLETLREEIAKQADLLVGQSLALEALREDETKHFQSREECDDLRHQTLVQALGSVPAGEPRAVVASVPGVGLQLQDGALERILEGLVAVAPLGETLVAHGAQLASLTGHLETAGTLMAVVPEKLEGSVRILDEALSTLRANQVEFGASVEVFTRAAEGMAGGLADKGMAPGTQTAMDGLMEQKAFLDALGKVLSGFSQSLSGVLGESSQRTQEVLVELCARLEGPQA